MAWSLHPKELSLPVSMVEVKLLVYQYILFPLLEPYISVVAMLLVQPIVPVGRAHSSSKQSCWRDVRILLFFLFLLFLLFSKMWWKAYLYFCQHWGNTHKFFKISVVAEFARVITYVISYFCSHRHWTRGKGDSFQEGWYGSEVDVLVLTDRPLTEKLKKWDEKFKGNYHSLRS